MTFWNIVGIFFWTYVFIAYLFALFTVIGDIFRDHTMHGVVKAIWIFFLVFVPFLTVLVYIIARGRGLATRSAERSHAPQFQEDSYTRPVAATSPSQHIADAKALLDAGTITQPEFEQLKQHAMSTLGTGPSSVQ